MGATAFQFQAADGLFDCAKGGLQQHELNVSENTERQKQRIGFTPSKRQRKEIDLDSSTAAAARLDDVSQMEDYLTRKKAEAERVRAETAAGLKCCAEERAMWSRSGVLQVHWSGDEPSDWADLDDDNQDMSASPSLLDRRGLKGLEGVVGQKLPLTLLESGLSADPMSPGPRACSGELESPAKGEKPRLPAEELPSPKDLQQHFANEVCSRPSGEGGKSRDCSRLQPL